MRPAFELLAHRDPAQCGVRSGMLGPSVASLHRSAHAVLHGKTVIVGIPDERGVIANLGAPGAAAGPQAFREAFYRLYDSFFRRGPNEGRLLSSLVLDAGDVKLQDTIEDTHESLSEVVAACLEEGAELVLVVGGGHDFAYGSYKGHMEARVADNQHVLPLVNLDAHLDLRASEGGAINSGTAFRRIIEHYPAAIAHGRALLELGIQRERNPEELYSFARRHGVGVVEYVPFLHLWRHLSTGREVSPKEHVLDHLDLMNSFGWDRTRHSIHLSLCLDVFRSDLAPGTSASTPFGAPLEELGLVLSYLGRTALTRVLDLAELCPPRDINGQSSRLAAAIAHRFILMRQEHGSLVEPSSLS